MLGGGCAAQPALCRLDPATTLWILDIAVLCAGFPFDLRRRERRLAACKPGLAENRLLGRHKRTLGHIFSIVSCMRSPSSRTTRAKGLEGEHVSARQAESRK